MMKTVEYCSTIETALSLFPVKTSVIIKWRSETVSFVSMQGLQFKKCIEKRRGGGGPFKIPGKQWQENFFQFGLGPPKNLKHFEHFERSFRQFYS